MHFHHNGRSNYFSQRGFKCRIIRVVHFLWRERERERGGGREREIQTTDKMMVLKLKVVDGALKVERKPLG